MIMLADCTRGATFWTGPLPVAPDEGGILDDGLGGGPDDASAIDEMGSYFRAAYDRWSLDDESEW